MTAEIGNLALIIAFIIAILQGILPLYGTARGHGAMASFGIPAARAQLFFVLVSYV